MNPDQSNSQDSASATPARQDEAAGPHSLGGWAGPDTKAINADSTADAPKTYPAPSGSLAVVIG